MSLGVHDLLLRLVPQTRPDPRKLIRRCLSLGQPIPRMPQHPWPCSLSPAVAFIPDSLPGCERLGPRLCPLLFDVQSLAQPLPHSGDSIRVCRTAPPTTSGGCVFAFLGPSPCLYSIHGFSFSHLFAFSIVLKVIHSSGNTGTWQHKFVGLKTPGETRAGAIAIAFLSGSYVPWGSPLRKKADLEAGCWWWGGGGSRHFSWRICLSMILLCDSKEMGTPEVFGPGNKCFLKKDRELTK